MVNTSDSGYRGEVGGSSPTRVAVSGEGGGIKLYQKGMFFMSNYMNRYGFRAWPLYTAQKN